MTLQKDLAEVAGMAEKATPGPWVANDGELATDLYWANGNMVADALSEFADGPSDPPNASFVAAAVNFIRTHHATITDMAKRLEAAERDGMCNEKRLERRCVCREEFGYRVCGKDQTAERGVAHRAANPPAQPTKLEDAVLATSPKVQP